MKRIYMTLGLLAALGTASYAQVADLAAVVEVDSAACLNAGQMMDTVQNGPNPYGVWGLYNNGPEAIPSGSTVLYLDPSCKKTGPSNFSVTGAVIPTDAQAGDYLGVTSFLSVDSINTLVSIDSLNSPNATIGSVIVPRETFVEGKTYAFYVYALGVGTDPNNPDNTDTVPANNFDLVPVVWHCNTSVKDMMEEAAQNINIFPNPAQNELHFRYGFIKPTAKATARVIDMTGRVLKSQELGKNAFGTRAFTMDISSLPAGNYMLEISTGYINAVGKFTVAK